MSEMEAPMEQSQDDIHEHAHHAKEPWIGWVAVTTAIVAALAAVTVLQAGKYADQSTEKLLRSFDIWNQFQAKGIKQAIAAKAPATESDLKNVERYDKEKEKLHDEATEETKEANTLSEKHGILAIGVTMFQVAIAIAAIAVLTKKPPMWYVGLAFSAVGIVFLIKGVALK